MPTNLQKLVAARMAKTGETYATALRYVRRRARRIEGLTPTAPPGVSSPRTIRHARTLPRDPAVDAYAESQRGPLGETIAGLIALVRAAVPAHGEIVVHGAPQFCIGGEPFCYLVHYARHVNLGFCEGAGLSDPDGLLEGKGKQMRHVKLSPSRTVAPEKLARLIAQSARRVGARRTAAGEVSHGRR